MGVKYGQGLRINGMGPEKDFSVSLTPRLEMQPETATDIFMPDATVKKRLMASEMTVIDITVTGNTKGLTLTTTNQSKLVINGNTARKIGNYQHYDPVKTQIKVETEYGLRLYDALIPELVEKAGKRDTGTYYPGTFGAACIELLNRLMGPYIPGPTSQDVYLDGGTYDATNLPPNVTRNPNRLIPELDLSGVSVSRGRANPAEEAGAGNFPVMLVSPRHAVCNKHSGVYTGLKVYFMRRDGSLQMVTVLGEIDLPSDGRVVMFDQDVTGCAIYSTLPPDWSEFMPSLTLATYAKHNLTGAIPVIVRQHNPGEQVETRWEFGINIINTNSSHLRVDWVSEMELFGVSLINLVSLVDEALAPFHMRAYGGDSGSPAFFLVPDKVGGFVPALITSYWTTNSGPSYPSLLPQITQSMHTLSTTYGDPRMFDMGTVDLSHFTRFTDT